MAFWSDTSNNVPAPKRNFRWLLYLGGIPAWICKKVTKPALSVTEITHEYLNHKFYYPGRVEWQTIDITLIDPVDPDAAETVYQIMQFSGYSPPESMNDTATINKSDAVGALGRVRIDQLGTKGQEAGALQHQHKPVESWILYNAWVKDIKWGELDYTNDELTEITLTLRYDFAKINGYNKQATIAMANEKGDAIDPGQTSPKAGAGVPSIGADSA